MSKMIRTPSRITCLDALVSTAKRQKEVNEVVSVKKPCFYYKYKFCIVEGTVVFWYNPNEIFETLPL